MCTPHEILNNIKKLYKALDPEIFIIYLNFKALKMLFLIKKFFVFLNNYIIR